jgi:DHA1 family bicyclomycin/chloramphenicol resistance-like MFS transporter
MVSVGPGLAPLVDGALTSTLGWRSIFFVLLCTLCIGNSLFAWRLLPETRLEISNTSVSTLGYNYRRFLNSPAFLGYAIGGVRDDFTLWFCRLRTVHFR